MTFTEFNKKFGVYLPSKIQNPTIVNNNELTYPLNTSLHLYDLSSVGKHVTKQIDLLSKINGVIKVKSFYEYGDKAIGKFKYNVTKGKDFIKDNKVVSPELIFIRPNQNVPVLPKDILLYNYNSLAAANTYLASPINPYYKALNTLSKVVDVVNIPVNRHEFINIPLPAKLPSLQELEKYTTKKMSSGLISKLPSNNYFILIELWKFLTPKVKDTTSLEKLTSHSIEKTSLILNAGSKSIILPLKILAGIIKEYGKDERYSLDTPKLKSTEVKKLIFVMLLKLYHAQLNDVTTDTDNDYKSSMVDSVAVVSVGADKGATDVDMTNDDISKVDISSIEKTIEVSGSEDVLVDDIGMTKADIEEIDFEEVKEDITIDSLKNETIDVNKNLVNKLNKLKDLGLITKNKHTKLTEALVEQRKIDVVIDGEVLNIGEVLDSEDDVKITKKDIAIRGTRLVTDEGMLNDTIGALDHKYIKSQMKKDFIRTLFDLQKGDQIITDIQTSNKSNILGSTTTYTVKLESLDGGVNTVKMITHNVGEDGVFKQSGNSYISKKQRTDRPIRKISNNEVSLTSNANKLFITRAYLKKDDIGYWMLKKITKKYMAEEVSSLVTVYTKMDTSKVTVPKTYEYISRYIKSFKFKSYNFNFSYKSREDLTKLPLGEVEANGGVLIGSKGSKPIVMMDTNIIYVYTGESFEEVGTLFDILDIDRTESPLEYASIKLFKNHLPVVLLTSYYIGLENLLKAYGVTYHLIAPRATYDKELYYPIKFKDHKLIIERDYDVNDIMFGGLKPLEKHLKHIDFKSLNKKDGFNVLLSSLELGTTNNILYITQIKQLENMFLDSITIRTLKQMKEPTTFKGLLIRAIELLQDDYYIEPNNIEGMVIKGYERMPGMMYNDFYKAVADQKNRSEFSKSKIMISPYSLIKKINEDSTVIIVDDNNPMAALKQVEDVTYIGYGGRSKESMSKETRVMTSSEIGIISEASKDSGDVGISAFMSANPKIKNTLGFTGDLDWDKDGWTSVLSTSAMISPLATKDDTKRLGFANIHNSHIIPITNAEIPYVRTPYGAMLGSRVNEKFAVTATGDGVVLQVTPKKIVVEYGSVIPDTKNIFDMSIKDVDFDKYKYIYEKQFKTTLDRRTFNSWKGDKFLIAMVKDNYVGFLRFKVITEKDDKYHKLAKTKSIVFVSDLAAVKKGTGARLMNRFLASNSVGDSLLVPSHDALINYYEDFGYNVVETEGTEYPSKVMLRHETPTEIHNKTYRLRSWFSKEESGGTFKHELVSNVVKGSIVYKDYVLMYDKAFFAPETYDRSRVVYKQGVNLLVGMVEDSETYEDSTALSAKTSELMSMDSIKIITKTIPCDKEVVDLVKIGQEVSPSTPICKILDSLLVDNNIDEQTMAIIQNLQSNVPTAKYMGTIEDIVIYYNCEKEDMSKSLKTITDETDAKLMEDTTYTGRVDSSYSIKGTPLIKGEIELKIYIKVLDDMSIADKAVYANQLKCTVGDVYDKIVAEDGSEVDAVFSTTSVQARIVGSVPIMGMLGYIAKKINEKLIEIYYE